MATDAKEEPRYPSKPCGICGRIVWSKKPPSLLKDGTQRRPSSWNFHNDVLWCDSCWKERYRTLCITVPVYDVISGGTWGELWKALRSAWNECGRAKNLCTSHCYVADDQIRQPRATRLTAFKTPYLYPVVRDIFKTISSASASRVARRACKSYKEGRLDLFLGKKSLPSFADQPLPLRGDEYTLSRYEDKRILLSFGLDGVRWTVSLGSRSHFGRQLATIDKLISGEGRQLESRISESRCGFTHRKSADSRDTGGQKRKSRIVVSLVCQIPKTTSAAQEKSGVMIVTTSPDSFLNVRREGRDRNELWSHEDHLRRDEKRVRRQAIKYRNRLQRLSDDNKIERRMKPVGHGELGAWRNKANGSMLTENQACRTR